MLKRQDVKAMEEIGKSEDGGSLFYILTKGGLSLVAKGMGDLFEVVSSAPHRGLAVHSAVTLLKGASWVDSLFKNEEMQKASHHGDYPESTPKNHFTQAAYWSQLAHFHGNRKANMSKEQLRGAEGHDADMLHEVHKDRALAHFKAGGLSHQDAYQAFNSHKGNHHNVHLGDGKLAKPPFPDYELEMSYNLANRDPVNPMRFKKTFPKGSHFSPTSGS